MFEFGIIDEVSLVYHVKDPFQILFPALSLVRFVPTFLIFEAAESGLNSFVRVFNERLQTFSQLIDAFIGSKGIKRFDVATVSLPSEFSYKAYLDVAEVLFEKG